RGLAINGFGQNNIRIEFGGGNVIESNFIGTDVTGTLDASDTIYGVDIFQSANNRIGGTRPEARNVISGNKLNGVIIANSGSTGNLVQGNFIGTDRMGRNPLPNGLDGVLISTRLGTSDIPSGNTIGGSVPGARNVISGNNYSGVEIYAGESNEIQGNYIGVDVTGVAALPNAIDGVLILNENSTFNVVGGSNPFALNVISGNKQQGVRIMGEASNNTVLGNFIGTNRDGDAAIANDKYGVIIFDAYENTIGGNTDSASNLISGNGENGVLIYGELAANNRVLTNTIGTDLFSTAAIPNGKYGVAIAFASGNQVGHPDALPTVISGNGEGGVLISGEGATGNRVLNSYIGLNFTGDEAIGNGKYGVALFQGAQNNRIGLASDERQNVISGNLEAGVLISGTSTSFNFVQGNFIGTDSEGLQPFGNGVGVVVKDGAQDNLIGGNATLPTSATNIISASVDNGVELRDAGANNKIQGNFIGTDKNESCALDSDGDCPLGNGGHGIFVSNTSDTLIGGTTLLNDGNAVAYNGRNLRLKGHGVVVESGKRNTIRLNKIFDNYGRGIDLVTPAGQPNAEYAFTVNDYLDGDDGPNGLINYPVVTKVEFEIDAKAIEWTMFGKASKKYVIDVYSNDELEGSGFGEGQSHIDTFEVTTNSRGIAKSLRVYSPVAVNIAATATDEFGNTSEFSFIDFDGDAIADAWESTANGGKGGIDVDEDGIIDLALHAIAKPDHKDIIVEIDAMDGLAPSADVLNSIRLGRLDPAKADGSRLDEGFANAPAAMVQNPDGDKGIDIHFATFADELEIPIIVWNDLRGSFPIGFDQFKEDFFGSQAERADLNGDNILAAKRLVYRYVVFANNVGAGAQSGVSEIPGNDTIVSLGRWRDTSGNKGGTDDEKAGTFMHELGHALNLGHGGGDHLNCKPNYHSVMSYTWQNPQTAYSGSWILDYSRSEFNTINENSINRLDGFGGHAGHQVPAGPAFDSTGTALPNPLTAPVNESGALPLGFLTNAAGGPTDLGPRDVSYVKNGCLYDRNGDGTKDFNDTTLDLLNPHADWDKLVYYFHALADFNDAVHGSDAGDAEMTAQDFDEFNSIGEGPGQIQFGKLVNEVFESDGAAIVRVVRVGGTDGAVSVDYRVTNDTATAGQDFTFVQGTLNFADGEHLQTFEVPILPDDLDEFSETANLVLSNAVGAPLGPLSFDKLLILDDLRTGAFEFSQDFFAGSETDGQALVTIRRVNGRSGAASIRVSTSNGAATAGQDYTATSIVVPFANAETVKSILVPILEDSELEGTESVHLSLSDPTNGAVLAPRSAAQLNIIDNDSPVQAIDDANVHPGHDLITFDIPGAGVQTITLTLELPVITDAVTIDGYTQPGASPNTLAEGNDAVILIELDGTNALRLPQHGNVEGLEIRSGNVTIRGLVIHSFDGYGISVTRFGGPVISNIAIEGNFIGTDPTGTLDMGNLLAGITLGDVNLLRIGGTDPASRNVISGNGGGISANTFVNTNVTIQGNHIGTQRDGVSPLGNPEGGIGIGGINVLVGGEVPGAGNVIAFNGFGVTRSSIDINGTTILSNSIHSNAGLGIDNGNPAINIPGNQLGKQNHPVLERAANTGATTIVEGRLDSLPNREYRLQFFTSPEIDVSGYGEGKTLLGSTTVNADADGFASFSVELPVFLPKGAPVTATSTRIGADRNTSQFSARVVVGEVLSSVITVNAADDADDGICDDVHCSLREAIFASNNHRGKDTIVFDIAPGGAQTIAPAHFLPAIVDPVILDATTQPGYAGTPIIELNGENAVAPGGLAGLHVATSDSLVRGLVVNRFNSEGILVGLGTFIGAPDPFGGNTIQGNYVGTDISGTVALPNFFRGILVNNSPNNLIGGPEPQHRNLASGNNFVGIHVQSEMVFLHGEFIRQKGEGNIVEGNYVGTDVTGTQAVGNRDGIIITGPGGIARNNLVSGNLQTGVSGAAPFEGDPVLIQGNLIGTDVTGTRPLGNGTTGLGISGAFQAAPPREVSILAGGESAEERNIVAASGKGGVAVGGLGAHLVNNYIGTDITGTVAFPNLNGVTITNEGAVVRNNLISGNTDYGVRLTDRFTKNNVVEGNLIGVASDEVSSLGNGGDGVLIRQGNISFLTEIGARDNLIGGLEDGQGNVIAHNGGHAISVGDFTLGNAFLSNRIYANGGLGIELGVDGGFSKPFISDGPTPNDFGDADAGPNDRQNFPLIVSVENGTGITKATVVLFSKPNTDYTVQFFSDAVDPSGHGEGQTLLGTASVTAGADGVVSFVMTLAGEVPAGQFVAATATDSSGNTSEFSEAVEVTALPEQEGGVNSGSQSLFDTIELLPAPPLPPVANAGGPYAGVEGAQIALDGSGSFDLGGAIVFYEWDTDNDGDFDDAAGAAASVAYPDNGVFTIGLRVTDADGSTATDTATVTVSNAAPVVEAGSHSTITEGDTHALDPATFTDAGVLDTHTATIDWGDGTVEPGVVDQEASTVSGEHTYDADGFYQVQVCVTDNDGGTGCDSFNLVVEPDIAEEGADLDISKTDFQDPVASFSLHQYRLSVNNNGPETAINTVMTDSLPPGMTFLLASTTQGACSHFEGVMSCNLGDLAAGAVVNIIIVVRPISGGEYVNTASVASDKLDPDPDDNADSETTTVTGDVLAADLTIGKSSDKPFIALGEEVTYTITVANEGTVAATSVIVTDALPSNLTFSTASPECEENEGMVTCFLGDVASGDSASVTIVATGAGIGPVTNFASAATDTLEFDTTDNTSGADTIVGLADLQATKTDLQDPVAVGEDVTYEITVTNLGPNAALNAGLTDFLPPGVAFVDASATAGECALVGPRVECEPGDIAPGDTVTVTLVLQAPQTAGGILNRVTAFSDTFDPASPSNSAQQATTIGEAASNTPPTASAGGPYAVDEGASVQLDAAGSSDAEQEPATLTYEWDFDGDSEFDDATGATPTFDPAALDGPATLTIALRVTDSDGAADTATAEITVNNVAPTAVFENTSGAITEGEAATLTFSGQSDPGAADSAAGFLYSYDCDGDGVFEAEGVADASFDCQYPDAGQFTALGRVKDKDGGFTDYTVAVAVESAPSGPALLDDFLEMIDLDTAYDPNDGRAPAGVYSITITWRNISQKTFGGIYAEVLILSGGNVLLNADGGLGGVGSRVTIPGESLGSDGLLSPQETFTQGFEIGLAKRGQFDFFVSIFGTEQ
ncbi:MAG: PKD domain-containing protein, partial [Chloroflexi bacterium]|nr:PKD domain-containing protein [Chloroflexota bacterium]